MRYLTLSWDDGFRKSSLKTAALFEQFGLRTEFNIVATGHLNHSDIGDFNLWNQLQERGHIIQPHGYNHTNKAQVPLAEAQELILKCLDIFTAELENFDPVQAIFNFPYNDSTPELEAWLPQIVRAFRTGPGPTLNPLPHAHTIKLTTCGWEAAEQWLDICLDDLLTHQEGWLIYNTHGLDGEGWGPLRASYLEQLLGRLTTIEQLQILPAKEVLAKFHEQTL